MILKELVNTYGSVEAANKVFSLYSGYDNLSDYISVMEELKGLEPSQKYGEILVEEYESSRGISYISISGWFPEEPEEWYAIEYEPWENWLNMEINTDLELSELEILGHILFEMTFCGYSNEEVQCERKEITDIYESLDSGSISTELTEQFILGHCPDCSGKEKCPICNP